MLLAHLPRAGSLWWDFVSCQVWEILHLTKVLLGEWS